MKNSTIFALIFCCILSLTSLSSRAQFVEKSTDAFCLLPSATGLGMVIYKKDRKGFFQLGYSSAACITVNYGLEAVITKDRPDGTGHHSFPSTHTAVAFNGATFLTRRYGWKIGVPAYLLASYVAWGRVYSDRHDVWDVLGGAVVGVGTALIFTRPEKKKKELRDEE